jgi:F420-dependent methylenetetrahydromethanopterin dehydrogenase
MTDTTKIAALDDHAKLKDVIAKMNEIIEVLNTKPQVSRDRGPESTREMTEDDARRILLGDLAAKNHKDAAKELGLSYGQVYSARKGFTFKSVYKEWRDAGNK